MESVIPVYPVARVVFPGERLGLRIADTGWLGVAANASRIGLLFRTVAIAGAGTEAMITRRRSDPFGQWFLDVVGLRRFRIAGWIEGTNEARVHFDPPQTEARAELAAAERELRSYLGVLVESGEDADVLVDLDATAAAASFQVASLMRLTQPERQELLDIATAAERLDRAARVLRRETALLRSVYGAEGR